MLLFCLIGSFVSFNIYIDIYIYRWDSWIYPRYSSLAPVKARWTPPMLCPSGSAGQAEGRAKRVPWDGCCWEQDLAVGNGRKGSDSTKIVINL